MRVHAVRCWAIALVVGALVAITSCGEDDAEPGPEDVDKLVTYGGREDRKDLPPRPRDIPRNEILESTFTPSASPQTLRRFEKLLERPEWSPADPPRNPQRMLEAVHEKTGLTFVLIPAGSFQMGSPEDEEERLPTEGPVHTVNVPAFMLCKTECTQRAWEKGGGKNASHFKGTDRPMESVHWTECLDWCAQNGLRLPSEAEWEYACRAGTRTRFSFGDDDADLAQYGWYFINSGKQVLPADTEWDPDKVFGEWGCKLHPVGRKLPNPWGLFDMHGNAREMCEGIERRTYGNAPTDGSAWTEPEEPQRYTMYRGGCCESEWKECRSASRETLMPLSCAFRPAADLPPLKKPDDGR